MGARQGVADQFTTLLGANDTTYRGPADSSAARLIIQATSNTTTATDAAALAALGVTLVGNISPGVLTALAGANGNLTDLLNTPAGKADPLALVKLVSTITTAAAGNEASLTTLLGTGTLTDLVTNLPPTVTLTSLDTAITGGGLEGGAVVVNPPVNPPVTPPVDPGPGPGPVTPATPTATATITTVTDDVGTIKGTLTTGGVTDDTTLTLSGTVAGTLATGEVIAIYNGTVKLGNATVSGSTWTFTTPTLAQGLVSLTAVAENGAVKGTASTAFTTTVDTTAPTAAAAPVEKSGNTVLTDGVNATEAAGNIVITAALGTTGAVAGDTIELKIGGASFGTPLTHVLTAGEITAGTYDFTVAGSALGADGAKSLTTVVTDIAGNVGAASSALSFTLDTTAPVVTALTQVGKTLTITAEAGSTLTILDGTTDVTAKFTVTEASGVFTAVAKAGEFAGTETLSLTAKATDAAGNVSAVFATPVTGAIDTKAPTATIVLADPALTVGETSLVTITFSEAVTGFTNDDVTVASGTLTAFTSADSGITWTATFTPTASTTANTNVISLLASYTDIAGNAGTVASSDNYTVNTVTAPAEAPTVLITDDTDGTATGPVTYTFTFSEGVTGFEVDDVVVTGGTAAASFATGVSGAAVYTLVVTPTAGASSMTVNVAAGAATGTVNAAGSAAALEATQVVDTTAFALSGTAEELAATLALYGVTPVHTGTVEITGATAATLEQLKDINAATSGAITLKDATITAAFSGLAADLAQAFAGITSSTGELTLTDAGQVNFADLEVIDLATTTPVVATSVTGIFGTAGDDIIDLTADGITYGSAPISINGGSGGLDTFTGRAGSDKFVLIASDAANRDVITNFHVGSGGDTIQLVLANTSVETAAGYAPVVTYDTTAAGIPDGGIPDGAYTLTGVTTANADVIVMQSGVALTSGAEGGDLLASTDGSELLKALTDDSAIDAYTGITSDGNYGAAYLLAYQGGKAFLYLARDADDNGFIISTEIALIGTFDNVAANGLTADNYAAL